MKKMELFVALTPEASDTLFNGNVDSMCLLFAPLGWPIYSNI